jgi:hypothetical protein
VVRKRGQTYARVGFGGDLKRGALESRDIVGEFCDKTC